MKVRTRTTSDGIALIIVMVVIFVLSVLAGGFAYSMRVETRLASNHSSEIELEWLGRSGVELAKYVLAQQLAIPGQRYDALNQKWAGGIGVTNESLMDITLEDNELGAGKFSIRIIDQERKFNINVAEEIILQQAINLIGVDATESSTIIDSILDWRDEDDDTHLSGTESDYYLSLEPPYFAKNGPIDDISELLMIQGVTPEIYWGPAGPNRTAQKAPSMTPVNLTQTFYDDQYQVGLVDLFTAVSGRVININTAPAAVLQLIPPIDANIAQGIIQTRAGPDGVEGTEDDTPFRNVGELINVPGLAREVVGQIGRFFTVLSITFEVEVDTQIGNYKRQYVALLRRSSPRLVEILYFYAK